MSDLKVLKVLFDQLIREEKRGQRFFADAAIYTDDSKIKRLFEHLSKEERQHLDLLHSIWKQINEDPQLRMRDEAYSKERMIEYAGQLQPVFFVENKSVDELKLPHFELFRAEDFKQLLEKITIRTVLQFAMKLEFDNAKFIVDFMKHIKSKKLIPILKKMVDEEKAHFIALKRVYDSLDPAIK